MLLPQGKEVSLGTKEIRDLTRIERIGAHSHIRGKLLFEGSVATMLMINMPN